jgi:hypothetical protein
MKRVPCEGTDLPPRPPPPHTQEELCQAELLRTVLEVKLHIMRVSEVFGEPNALRKPTSAVLPCLPFFHKNA